MTDYISNLRKKIGNCPIFLVGATIIVINKNNEILLQFRSDSKDWGLPGGAMELGETFLEVAKRELFEETNLVCDEFELLDILSGKEFYYVYPNGDETYNIIALYKAINPIGELKIDNNESLDLKYFKVGNFPKLEKRAKIILDKINKYNILVRD